MASMPNGAYSYLNGQRVKSYLKRTDGEFWQILDFDFVEGARTPNADVADHRMVAVINESTRQRFFGGQPALGGRSRSTASGSPSSASCPTCRSSGWSRSPTSGCRTPPRSPTATRARYVGDFIGIFLLRGHGEARRSTRDELWSRLRTVEPGTEFTTARGHAGDALRHRSAECSSATAAGTGTGLRLAAPDRPRGRCAACSCCCRP